jgi:hypothetical protein
VHQLPHLLPVRIGEPGKHLLKQLVTSPDKPVPPLFNLPELSCPAFLPAVNIRKRFVNRFNVNRAHQRSDILHLPFPGAVPGKRAGQRHSLPQRIGQGNGGELFGREPDQPLPCFLQLDHLPLETSFTFAIRDFLHGKEKHPL